MNNKKLIALLALIAAASVNLWAQGLPRLAVVEFSTNNSAEKTTQDAVTIRNLVESGMVASGKFEVISRNDIDKMLTEQKIAVSAITSTENVRKLQLMNISYIVTGSVDALGLDYAVTVKVLDVSSGKFSHSANNFMGGASRELYTGVNTLVGAFIGGMSSEGGQVVQTGRTDTGKVYKVGDFGPAGGIIFYDKGVFSNGWRYLEAAPAETEFTASWGAYVKNVSGTAGALGRGKQNTQILVDYLRQIGESGKAAQLCAALDFDGFKDWFLPSKDELDLMYKNLKQKGLGGFGSNWYWSSSRGNHRGAWVQHFGDGSQGEDYMDRTNSVRAVRVF
jgi:hypothetical protein